MLGIFRISLFILSTVLLGTTPGSGQASRQPVPGFSFEIKVGKELYWEAVSRLDPERTDPAKVAASPFPAYCAILTEIVPKSQADKAGLKKGWRIASLNGGEVWTHLQPLASENGRREVGVISPEGIRKTVHFKKGRIGITTTDMHRPEIEVLRLIPRGTWDGDLMVATTAWDSGEHELAETALRLAVNRGMPPNPVLLHYASLIAFHRGNVDLAKNLNDRLLKDFENEQEIPRFYRHGLRTLAAAFGDFTLLARICAEYEDLERPAFKPEIAEEWKRWKEAGTRRPLAVRAAALTGEDLLPECSTVVARWQAATHVMDFKPAKDGKWVRVVNPGKFHRLSFGPSKEVDDLMWKIRFGVRETGFFDGESYVLFCLIDKKELADWSRRARYLPLDKSIASFKISSYGALHTTVSIGPCGARLPIKSDVSLMPVEEFKAFRKLVEDQSADSEKVTRHVNELSLIRLGDEAEISLNGKKLLHAPIDPKVEDLFCIIQIEGISLIIDGMSLHEILPEKAGIPR